MTGQDARWSGGSAGARALAVLCPNPSPMTLEGTNTWILSEPGSDSVVVVDPGPGLEEHLQNVLAEVARQGARVALTLLTHSHADHAESAGRWAELTGAPVRGAGHGQPFTDDELIEAAGLQIRVLLTPGHTADSVSFLIPEEGTLLTGDTVLGRGTTVVAYPDGDLTSYLASLERLRYLAAAGQVTTLAPGHGPVRSDAVEVLEGYLAHREDRLKQVCAALAQFGESPHRQVGESGTDDLADRVVRTVYADVPRDVWPAARRSVLAQLDYLGEL